MAAQSDLTGNCPYCMSPILSAERQIICPGCEVPHHDDCWKENKGCTTMGCNGRPISNSHRSYSDYSFDDLAQEYSANKLVINIEDLDDEYLERTVSSVTTSSDSANASISSYSAGSIGALILAGLFGGILTWLISLEFFNYELYVDYQRFDLISSDIISFSAFMSGLLGMVLGSTEGITGKVFSKTIVGMIKGLTIGIVGGGVGAIIGQFVLIMFIDYGLAYSSNIVLFRAIFWGSVGAFIGFTHGISAGGGERAKNGLFGGAMGGAIGGLLFEFSYQSFDEALTSALIAILAFGFCIGLGIGLVQEYRKEAWFKVLNGPTAGKEYIIQGEKTTVGSSPKCDIALVRDPYIESYHADVRHKDDSYTISTKNDLSTIKVNNKAIRDTVIKNGDRLKMGRYELIFYEKIVE